MFAINFVSLIFSIIVEAVILFIILLVFTSRGEKPYAKLLKALIFSSVFIIGDYLGKMFGIPVMLVIAILNTVLVMKLMAYTFTSAMLFMLGLGIINYLILLSLA